MLVAAGLLSGAGVLVVALGRRNPALMRPDAARTP